MFGDNVMSVNNIPGHLFRKMHNIVKTVLKQFLSHIRDESRVRGV